MDGATTMITGGAGFIGTNLALALLARGARVTVLALPSDNCSHLPPAIRIVRADITSPADLHGAFDGQEYVFHLAARCDLDGRTLEDYRANHEGTEHVIGELRGSPTLRRFVFYSTQLVVGIQDTARFIDEDEPYWTRTLYGESKIRAEQVTVRRCTAERIPYTIIRPTSVYGPHGNEPYDAFFRMIRDGRYVHIGAADNLVSMVYVGNLVDLTILLAQADGAVNGIFFGNDFHPYTMREFADAAAACCRVRLRTVPVPVAVLAAQVLGVLRRLGVAVPLHPARLRNIRASYCYDVRKAVRLGYDPQYDMYAGIAATLAWYEENRWTRKAD